MREIKFRVWDIKNSQMWYGGFYVQGDTGDVWLDSEDGLVELNQDTLVLMQFTGLHDKNGRENDVYDSDIIYDGWNKCNRTIVFENGCFYADRIVSTSDGHSNRVTLDEALASLKSKIIGNIYENPELLKENKV